MHGLKVPLETISLRCSAKLSSLLHYLQKIFIDYAPLNRKPKGNSFYFLVPSKAEKKQLKGIVTVFLKKKKTCSVFFFFSKPPVFKVNIHNLSQFVNHTVTLVQNKNNNERISFK